MRQFIKKLLGGSPAPRAARPRPPIRLEVERLDERVLLSNTGSISQVFTNNLGTVTFSIEQDKNLYASCNGGHAWRRLDNGFCDLQVTAGTDQNGNAVAYVLNKYGSLWALSVSCTNPWDANNTDSVSKYTPIADNVVFDPGNHWSSITAAMGRDYYNGNVGGVFYISNHYDYFFQLGRSPQLVSSAGTDYQISAGTDHAGYNVMYVLNGVDHNIYERHANYSWSKIDLSSYGENGDVMQIAGSVNNIVYFLVDPWGGIDHQGAPYNLDGYELFAGAADMWNGYQLSSVSYWWGFDDPGNQYVTQISAGTDAYGHSTLDFSVESDWNGIYPIAGNLFQFDTASGQTYLLASHVREICAGQWGYDYWADWNWNLQQHDQWGDFWQIGDHVF